MEEQHDRRDVSALSFNPEGRLLASGGVGGLIRIWDVKSRRMIGKPLHGHDQDSTIYGLAFDSAGRILASASTDRTVQLWNVKTWGPLDGSPLTGPESSLTGMAFSPKGDRLVASVIDGTVFLWDVKRRIPIGSGLRGSGKALNIAFHPDGEHLVAGTENSVLLFDLRYGLWRDQACRIAGRNFTEQEWGKYLPHEPYQQTCPAVK
jgi:YD repeat-containing protein